MESKQYAASGSGALARLRRDWSLSAVSAGFLAVLVSYAGPLAIFFHAAEVGHVGRDMVTSWVWAISIGAALSGILLSWTTKVPVITAWSAPGTALLVTLFPALPLPQVVGAYITAALILFLIGWSGYFDRIMQRIPRGIAAGMMAGILFQFGAKAFSSATAAPLLGGSMVLAYLLFRRLLPRYCIVLVLLVGVLLSLATGTLHDGGASFSLTRPQFIAPQWSIAATLSLAIPLVIVSLTGQFLPGMAILRGAGYTIPARPILLVTSVASLLVACFGGVTIVVAAITAALCTGKDAHEDPGKRYVAGIANGVFYLLGGLFSGAIVLLFAALSKSLVAILAGVALIGAITANLLAVLQDEEQREASMITFLATASGMSYAGLGAAFWGVLIGSIASYVLRKPEASGRVKTGTA
ncbi:benzoate/H(+) symporter BenE family transporter [Vogesella indigofera]|uniref:benzoate/H(+) symporter BenE family transporter n=1 Tax=Vogesella indigofera TaxID=45465 RepID=UPI00234EEF35|nr:benzoate/H(+) symporter BenE family transporter [Vogesella indigofera]MDC7696255.1 benzoate/H(+) symporter BenE family transporter [Vogesella indigofera]